MVMNWLFGRQPEEQSPAQQSAPADVPVAAPADVPAAETQEG